MSDNAVDMTEALTAEQKKAERNRKNTERIKNLYHNVTDFRNKMKENSKRRYASMKDIIQKAEAAGLLQQT